MGESVPATPMDTTQTRQGDKGRGQPPKPTLALAYDFDGTLAPGNMQEHAFMPTVSIDRGQFWTEVKQLAKSQEADEVLVYMHLMLEKARAARVPVHRKDIQSFGSKLRLFSGVRNWFGRIDAYGKSSGVRIEHYIISSGIKEIVEGTSIGTRFKAVFASSFLYDPNDVATWPALALNYTTKTQYLFRINKGSLTVTDHSKINSYVPQHERRIPFEHIVYIGDGETDIPCFRLVKELGGHSIAVYDAASSDGPAKSEKLMSEGRISFAAPADYGADKRLDRVVKGIIDKVAADYYLALLGKAPR